MPAATTTGSSEEATLGVGRVDTTDVTELLALPSPKFANTLADGSTTSPFPPAQYVESPAGSKLSSDYMAYIPL